jgi:hypothetical protein
MTKDLILPENSIANLGQIFAASGYFQDARDASQAIVKILAGQELGLPPIASMTGIHIIKGKVSLSATTMAAVLKRHGNYDYRVLEHSHEGCKIEFFQNGESIGISEFTMEDAKMAGLMKGDNYRKYPRNMLFARAMSNGIRWYCPDILGGPAYTPGELDHNADEGGDDQIVEGDIDDLSEFVNGLNEREMVTQEVRQMAANGKDLDEIVQAIQDNNEYKGNYDFSDIVEMTE